MEYPLHYIIKNKLPQAELDSILACIASHQEMIEEIRDTKNEKSRKIELLLKPRFQQLGYAHSVTNKDYPLFSENSLFEIDFFHPHSGIAIEIERSNLYTKVWLALVKMLESDLVRHGLIFVPIRRFVRNSKENSYELTYKRLRDNAHNLLRHLESLIVVGY